eukprot:10274.XXX_562074_562392_1 [CDS] Oithona nana genome sequencing.
MKIFGLLILLVFLTTTQTHSFRLPMPYGTGFPHFNWSKPNKDCSAEPENLPETTNKARNWLLVLSRMKRVECYVSSRIRQAKNEN